MPVYPPRRSLHEPPKQEPPKSKMDAKTWVVGGIAAACVLLAAYVIYQQLFAGKRRPQPVSSSSSAPSSPSPEEIRRMQQQARDVQQQARQMAERQAEAAERGEVVGAEQQLEQGISLMRGFADQLEGPQRTLMQATLGAMETVLDEAAAYDRAMGPLIEEGGVDPATLDSIETIDQRIAAVDEALTAIDRLDQAFAAMPEEIQRRINEADLPEDLRRIATASIEQSAQQFDAQTQMLDVDREIGLAMIEQLFLLRDHWGQWSVEGGELSGDDDAFIARYNEFAERQRALSEQKQSILREAMSNLRSGP